MANHIDLPLIFNAAVGANPFAQNATGSFLAWGSTGENTVNGPQIAPITVDPSAGTAANVASMALRNNAGAGELWLKTGGADTNWTNVALAGRQAANTATSGSIGNTAAETVFTFASVSGSTTLPANSLTPGRTVNVKFAGRVAAIGAANTLAIRCRLGGLAGPILIEGVNGAAAVAGDIFYGDFTFICLAAGAPGSVSGAGIVQGPDMSGTLIDTAVQTALPVDTTIAQNIVVTAQWSGVNAGDSAILDMLAVNVT